MERYTHTPIPSTHIVWLIVISSNQLDMNAPGPVLTEAQVAKPTSGVDEKAVLEMFQKYDTDGNGTIDLKEFTKLHGPPVLSMDGFGRYAYRIESLAAKTGSTKSPPTKCCSASVPAH